MLSHKKHVDVPKASSETDHTHTLTWDRLARQIFYLANGIRDLHFIAWLLHKPRTHVESTAQVMSRMGILTVAPEQREVTIDADILQSSYNQYILPRQAEFSHSFFARLFATYPQTQALFTHTTPEHQEQAFILALTATIAGVRHGELVRGVLRELGKRHVSYGVAPEHYPIACAVLIETLREFMGRGFTPVVEQAWIDGLEVVSGIMLEGAILG